MLRRFACKAISPAFIATLLATANVARAQESITQDELERIDSTIYEAPYFPGRGNPLDVTTKAELRAWSTPLAYGETPGRYQSTHFGLKWSEATVFGNFPTQHCCTEVLINVLKTSHKDWIFFGRIRIGDAEREVLDVLGPVAKRTKGNIEYCGDLECVVFELNEGVVSEVTVYLGLD